MAIQQIPLLVPELNLDRQPVMLSCWLTPIGTPVVAGDRVVELISGEVTVDLPAPASGTLTQRMVKAGQQVEEGQILAVIHADPTIDAQEEPETR
jgi:2-oxoglutarate dehydrogenase E2 component (dihydrolipoamide succinyltransferase)